jgi:hypothetical protein
LGIDEGHLDEILVAAENLEAGIVGGQALNIWAELLFDRAPDELEPYAPYTSKDIDYFGTARVAAELASILDGEVSFPDPDHVSSPNSAIVSYQRDGKRIVIDFLAVLAGLTESDGRDGFVEAEVMAGPDGGRPVRIRLLHPLLVLKSRIAGIITLGRRDDTAIRQLRAAPIVLREYIRLRRDLGCRKEVADCLRRLASLAGNAMIDPIYIELDVDLVGILDALGEDTAWDPRFRDHQIVARSTSLRARRERRLKEQRRKAERR